MTIVELLRRLRELRNGHAFLKAPHMPWVFDGRRWQRGALSEGPWQSQAKPRLRETMALLFEL